MKTISLIFTLFLSLVGLSQKIDYSNFDSKRASEVLAETFLKFRDTITTHHLSLDNYKISDVSPEMNTSPSLRKLRWSDWLYTNLSTKNCDEIINMGNKMSHSDKSEWVKSNKSTISKIAISNVVGLKKSEVRVMYNENLYQYTGQFETYQDLAISIIKSWDKSELHSAIMRCKNYSDIEYDNNKVIMTALFSCSVKYNPVTKYTKAVLNIMDIT
jgi:hypothetical protein